MLSVGSRNIELIGGYKAEFSAKVDLEAARVSIYGCYKSGIVSAVGRTDV